MIKHSHGQPRRLVARFFGIQMIPAGEIITGAHVGANKFVFSAIRREFIRSIVAIVFSVTDVSSADTSAAVTFKLIGCASERRRLILPALTVFNNAVQAQSTMSSHLYLDGMQVSLHLNNWSPWQLTGRQMKRVSSSYSKWTQTLEPTGGTSTSVHLTD